MVTVKYYSDPINLIVEEKECSSVSEWLCGWSKSKEEFLDLRFFHDEILGQEIDTSDLLFLDISNGVVAITHNSMIPRGPDAWIYILVAVVAAIITVALTPKARSTISNADSASRKQSATNRLGFSVNEPRINERIDDIFGSVTKHTPPLWQVPYRVGVDNQETEVLLLCIGRGKYLLEEDEIYDGNTRIIDINNAQFSRYEPGSYPGNGVPSLQIGDDINEKIGVYIQSNDLNPSELLPASELSNSNLDWELTGVIVGEGPDAIRGRMKATFIPIDFDFENYYKVGDIVFLEDIKYFEFDGNKTLYDVGGGTTVASYNDPIDLGDIATVQYVVSGVTSDTVTVILPFDAPQDIIDAWTAMVDYVVPRIAYRALNTVTTSFYTFSDAFLIGDWYEEVGLINIVNITTENYIPSIGNPSSDSGVLGPFVVPVNAEEIILNFVSENGFYKLDSNIETSIVANIDVTVEELDSEGITTGELTIYSVAYTSNEVISKSVFKTERILLPYARSRVSAIRTTDRDNSVNISNVDVIKWRDLYSFESVSSIDFGDVTLAHVVIPSNSQSQLIKERKQNMDVTRLITEYLGDGNFGASESLATDDFSQILIHISLDQYIGRLTLDDINADGFLLLSEQIKTYFGSDEMVRFGYDFDSINVTYQDSFILISNVVNCLPYAQNGVYDTFFESVQDVSSAQITCRNKIIQSESREQIFERRNDGVEVSYRDEITSISETIYLPNDRSAINPDIIELSGCVTQLQAFRYASRVFNKQLYSRLQVVFDVDEFGRNIIPGKRIDSPDSTRFTLREGVTDGYKIYEGEVVEVSGLNVELSEPVVFTVGEDHYIVFTNENGDNSESILCTEVDDFTVLLSVLPSESIYDGYSRDRTKYTFSSEQLRDSIALLPQTIEFKINDEGDETNTIGSINYSPLYYKDDLEFPS